MTHFRLTLFHFINCYCCFALYLQIYTYTQIVCVYVNTQLVIVVFLLLSLCFRYWCLYSRHVFVAVDVFGTLSLLISIWLFGYLLWLFFVVYCFLFFFCFCFVVGNGCCCFVFPLPCCSGNCGARSGHSGGKALFDGPCDGLTVWWLVGEAPPIITWSGYAKKVNSSSRSVNDSNNNNFMHACIVHAI